MRLLFTIIISITTTLLFSNCKSKSNESPQTEQTQPTEAAHDEEKPATTADLTAEQIKTVGIVLGNIESKNLTATIKANGVLRVPNNRKANVTSSYSGVVKTLNVQLGNHVSKGQVIATIENPQFVQLQEEYLTTASRINFAEQEMRRQKQLYEGNAGALKNLQNATAELNAIRARRASLQQQIRLMGISTNKISTSKLRSTLAVTSPISGTVSNEFAKIGSYVDASSPVVEIVDNSLLHLDLQVFEKDLSSIAVGQTVNFTLTNNPKLTYMAKVFNIGSSFENESKTIAVHCTVIGEKKGLIDGMNITALISTGNEMAATVPDEAIVEADGKFYIFITTNKKLKGSEEKHTDENEANHEAHNTQNFEKIEIVKGVSDLGYTAITPVVEIPAQSKVVVKGAFFINAKLNSAGGHDH